MDAGSGRSPHRVKPIRPSSSEPRSYSPGMQHVQRRTRWRVERSPTVARQPVAIGSPFSMTWLTNLSASAATSSAKPAARTVALAHACHATTRASAPSASLFRRIVASVSCFVVSVRAADFSLADSVSDSRRNEGLGSSLFKNRPLREPLNRYDESQWARPRRGVVIRMFGEVSSCDAGTRTSHRIDSRIDPIVQAAERRSGSFRDRRADGHIRDRSRLGLAVQGCAS